MILAFFGDGKGKTTSAIGTMLRTLNLGQKVLLVQFFKGGKLFVNNEVEFLKNLKLKNLKIIQIKSDKWINFEKIDKSLSINIQKEYKSIEKTVFNYKLIVLDEILLCNYYKIISDKNLINLFEKLNNKKINLIITGRKFNKKLEKYIDLITEMKKIKHPFDNSQKAVEGLDF